MVYSEYGGGIILKECPVCGQFCKVPKTYRINGLGQDAHANSYCKRCQKKVKLAVVFI